MTGQFVLLDTAKIMCLGNFVFHNFIIGISFLKYYEYFKIQYIPIIYIKRRLNA